MRYTTRVLRSIYMTEAHIFQLFGFICLASGIGFAADPTRLRKICREFLQSPALTYLIGVVALVLGFALLGTYGAWGEGVTVILTLIGWVAVFKGLLAIASPSWFEEVVSRYIHNENMLAAASGLVIAFGLGSLLVGYVIL